MLKFADKSDDIKLTMVSAKVPAHPDNPEENDKESKIEKFNRNFALRATDIFGSMGTFYAFCIWACLPLIPILAKQKDTILYISSGFIQLIALPLILVGQNIMNSFSEKRSERTLQTVERTSTKLENIFSNIASANIKLSNETAKHIENTVKSQETTSLIQSEIIKVQMAMMNDLSEIKKILKIKEDQLFGQDPQP